MARKRKRGRRNKRRSSNQINSVIIRGPSAFPDRVFVRLRYTNSFAISAAELTTQVFSGNSPYQIDKAVSTEKPRGFKEWMAIYELVKVHKSTIKAQVLNIDPALTLDCVVLPKRDSGLPTLIDTEDAREQPYAKSKRLSPLSGSQSTVTVFNSMKTKTIFGTKFINDDYAGEIAKLPTGHEWRWIIYLQNLVNDTGVINCDMTVTVVMFMELYRRKFIPRGD